jgi:hypothetical protein
MNSQTIMNQKRKQPSIKCLWTNPFINDFFQIMGIYVVLHSRNISNTFTQRWAQG